LKNLLIPLTFNLADKIGNHEKFKKATKYAMEDTYRKCWTISLSDPTLARLLFYKKIKTEFKMESYLETLGFENRRVIAKIKCSDHALEIEKGRHKNKPRHERICTMCHIGHVEDEEHFLFSCKAYNALRVNYNLQHLIEAKELFNDINHGNLAKYLTEALTTRDEAIRAAGRMGVGLGIQCCS